MWPRLRLDIGWLDLAAGLAGLVRGSAGSAQEADELVCLSVRSGFDLLLGVLALPRGSEVMLTALTIPHMADIVRHHGLVAVPIDLDPDTLAPTAASLERARTTRSRVLVVAHLFGGRVALESVGVFARAHDLLLVEDCAQAFVARGCERHPEADVSLFSFGTIKTATALGGAVVRARDGALLDRMRRAQATWPRQSRAEYGWKLARAALLRVLGWPPAYGAFTAALRTRGRDLDAYLQGAVAGFPGPDLPAALRRRPCAALERLLRRRRSRYGVQRIAARRRAGEALVGLLPRGLARPGTLAVDPTHWVFPILAPQPEEVVATLRRAGFDATRRSSLVALPAPAGHPCGEPRDAGRLLERMVFLPSPVAMSAPTLRRLARTLSAGAGASTTATRQG